MAAPSHLTLHPSVRPSHLDSVEQMHPVDGDDLVVLLLRLLRGTADFTALYHSIFKNYYGMCFIFLTSAC